MQRFATVIGGSILIAGIGIVLFSWYRFRTPLVGHVELSPNIQVASFDVSLETHSFTTADGVALTGYSATQPEDTAAKGWILLVHGFTPNGWKSMLGVGEFLYQEGFNVFWVSLRSYGESEGDHVYLGTQEWQDVVAADAFISAELNQEQLPVGWYGVSMGAASSLVAAGQVTANQAADQNTAGQSTAGQSGLPKFLIAQVPFASIQSLLYTQIQQENLPLAVFQPLAHVVPPLELGWGYQQFTPLATVDQITVPTLIIGAEWDNQVQFSDSQLLYERLSTPTDEKMYRHFDTGHDVYAEKPGEVQTALREFLEKTLSRP